MANEIERKFLVKGDLSDLTPTSEKSIRQNYITTGNQELRIRKITHLKSDKAEDYILTSKKGKGLVREEDEITLEKETYESLSALLTTKPLLKETLTYDLEDTNLEAEVDVYFYAYGIPTVVEVEFTSVEEAEAFQPPSWIGKDITDDPSFKNQNLWKLIQD